MNLYPRNKLAVLEVKRFIVIFYIVGTLGFLIPFTKDLFVCLTPFALLLNTYLLAVYHKRCTVKSLLTFLLIFFLGYFIEVVGVRTGLVFGVYQYGDGLGIKLLSTPLLIGANWLFLSYASLSVVRSLNINISLTLVLAPLLMLIYDLVLEQVAPKMDMWAWHHGIVPVQNYVAWYLIAFIFVCMLHFSKIDTRNSIAKILLLSQFVFFVFLMFILK